MPSSLHSNPVIPPAFNLAAIVAAIVSDLKSSLVAIAALAEKALAEEKRHQDVAAQEKALADKANEQRQAAAMENALVEKAHKQRRTAEHATTLVVTALTKLKATPKVRYGGPPPTHFSSPLTTAEVAKLDAANLDRRRHHETAAREKALADEANKRRRAAAHEKALADEANKQCRAAMQDIALADEANERRCHESAKRATTLVTKALAKNEYDEDDNYVARQIEAYAAPFFACVDAVMAKIRAMDDGFGNWAAFSDELLIEEDNKASAPTMPPLAPPTAVSSPPHHPKLMWMRFSLPYGGALKRHPLL